MDELVQLASDHELPHVLALGRIMRGWALAAQGHCEEGIVQLREGIEMQTAMRYGLARGYHLSLLAEALARNGAVAEARAVMDDAFAAVAESVIEKLAVLQLRGELLAGDGCPEAEASFRGAIELARCHDAKMYELRSATSLACYYMAT